MTNEDHSPSWLDEGNDTGHRSSEASPLLGSGKIDLTDAENTEIFGPASKPTYGSSASGGGGDDDDDEEKRKKAASKDMFEDEPAGEEDTKDPKKHKPDIPTPNMLLAVFFFLEGCGILSSLALLATQIIPIWLLTIKQMGLLPFLLKIYVSLFCILFMTVESDPPIQALKNAAFLRGYLFRGFLYSFVGLSCAEEAYSERVKDMLSHAKDTFHVAWLSLFIDISSWVMIGLGAIYMLLGICCMKGVRDRMKTDYKKRWKTYREHMKIYKRHNKRN